jgi:hypothetical protein
MNGLFTATVFLLLAGSSFGSGTAVGSGASNPASIENAASTAVARTTYGALPLSFEINEGQADRNTKFVSRGHGHTLFLTSTGFVLSLQRAETKSAEMPMAADSRVMERAIVQMELVNARADASVQALEPLPGKVNYLRGADARRWRLGIPTYGRVRYRNVYPGVDLVYYGNQGELEYDFVVKPGGDPSAIRLRFEGADLSLDASGDVVGLVPGGEVRMRKPVLYQEVEGRRVDVTGSWVVAGAGDASFQIAEYDASRPLVIDPILSYSTYLGGSGDDNAVSIAVDARGHAYVTGSTVSTNFPTTADAMQPANLGGFGDAFLTKLNRDGTGLLYSTYFGGTGSDAATDIALDPGGNIYVVGATQSADFPTTANSLQAFAGATDAFVAKFDSTGAILIYSTFLGGSAIDDALGLAVDPSGIVYLAGFTESADFPTTAGAFQTTNAGGFDAFVASIDRTGSALRYSTYVGAPGSSEGASDLAIDSLGQAHIVGTTRGTAFPTTPGALQTTADGLSDQAFISKLNGSGTALLYSTYFGGAGNDGAFAVTVDQLGLAYVAGFSNSDGLPTTEGAFQPTRPGGDDGFVLKLDQTGSAIRYLTYLGGAAQDWVEDIAVDALGQMYLTGTTESTNFPVKDAPQPVYGGNTDAFVTSLTRDGSSAVYSTYLGGNRREDGMRIAVDLFRNTYVTGFTSSPNMPTTVAAFQTSFGGDRDSFVTKLGNARGGNTGTPEE